METKSAKEENAVNIVTKEQYSSALLNFSNAEEREAHIQTFLAWLPKILHEAPGIRWEQLPSPVMGYLIRTVADSPDAIPIALAIGCALDGVKKKSLYTACSSVAMLFKRLRTHYGLTDLAQLRKRDIWERFVAERELPSGEVHELIWYECLASVHVGAHRDGLTKQQQIFWEPYLLPQLPRRFIDKHGIHRNTDAKARQRRKEQSDVLVPLFPLLTEIAQLRKQAAQRLVKEFRRQKERALTGEIELPYQFQYTDHLISVSENAATIAEVKLIEREVTLSFTLWDRVSWIRIKEHFEQCSPRTRCTWAARSGAYAPEHNICFLQYEGPQADLLWFGDILAQQLYGRSKTSVGFQISRSALLTPTRSDSHWMSWAKQLEAVDTVLFEPESLYRGVLYGAALASLCLTNGSRASELLQVSTTRFETIVVDELKNRQPTGRKIGIVVQNLLPKGCTHESERQFFLVSDMASRLLREIFELLRATHGKVPIVHPHYHNRKAEDLYPEPYLFQWAADADGRLGNLMTKDTANLLRFLFHGLTLTTRTGKPIRVASHLFRHVLATHARQVKNVPAEAVAYLLHHRVTIEGSSRALSIPEATAYYSRMPVEQLLALLFEAQSQLSSHQTPSYLQAPLPSTIEQMDEALRKVYEQWSLIGPTALGYCSAGLCVRPNNRALCLDCPFLVPHYSNLRNARIWRRLYLLHAKMHDEQGHCIDAEEARKMARYLDDIINIMQIQIRTRQDGGYLPFADTLPPAQDNEGDGL